jgi:formylglycine-generating enzyme required for sulfatase activity
MKLSFFCRSAFASVLLLLSLTACGGGGGGGSTPSDSSLTVTVTITGSTGLDADVTVTGPGSYSEHLTATQTLTGLARGTYTITAGTITDTNLPGLGRGNGGTLGPEHLQRYPLKPVQKVAVDGADAATVTYPDATKSVSIPVKGTPSATVPMVFVLVPAGSFTMGSTATEDSTRLNAQPPHTVTTGQAFYVAETELTLSQWTAVMGSFTNDNHPVEQVSWDDIRKSGGFLDQLNAAVPGKSFRLPSEAEWEYVCRARTTTAFFFGADATNLDTYAVWETSNTAVGKTKAPNPWGLYDILGNVWEWNEDDSHSGYNLAPADGSAWVDSPLRSGSRIQRGGGWSDTAATYFRSAFRNYDLFATVSVSRGFRLVMPAP